MSTSPRKKATTDVAIKSAKPEARQYKMSAGSGMYLLVKPNGSKLWQMKYRYGGKEKTLSIGQYPEISLSAAKLAREQARQQLANGVDPSQAKQEEKIQQQSEHLTFRTVAERWFTGNTILAKKPWSAGTARKARLYLEKDIFPAVGEKPIASITRKNLNDISERMEKRGAYDAAISVREWLDSIFLTAYDNEEIESNPAYRLKPSIYAKGHQGGHYPHISFEPVLFMRAPKVTHFRQPGDPLTVFGLEGSILGSAFSLAA